MKSSSETMDALTRLVDQGARVTVQKPTRQAGYFAYAMWDGGSAMAHGFSLAEAMEEMLVEAGELNP